ncbi:hypothetical protein ACX80J_09400 [Arthrobacter sp. MDB2-24]
MGNPAAELHELFVRWSSNAELAPYIARELAAGDDSDRAFDDHIRAMRLISEIDMLIARLEQTLPSASSYRKSLRRWAGALMNYPQQWQGPKQAQLPFTDLVMNTLEGLAVTIDAMGPVIDVGGEEKLKALLVEIEELLSDDDSIDGLVRGHLYEAVKLLRRYLDDVEFYGEADFAAALRDLWVTMNAASNQADTEHKGRWDSLLDRVGVPAAATVLGSMPTIALQAIGMATGTGGA